MPRVRLMGFQIGASDTGQEGRIPRKQPVSIQQVAGTFQWITRRTVRYEMQGRSCKCFTVMDGSKGKASALLRWQEKHGPTLEGYLAGTGEMIRVDMSIQNAGDLPSVPGCQIEVDLRVQ